MKSKKIVKIKRAMGQFRRLKPTTKKADFLLLFSTFLLSIFGLIMVYDASIVEASENLGDQFHYLKFQAVYFTLGWIGLLAIAHLDYHWYRKIITPLFIFSLLLLLFVLIPGIGLQIKGARRWIDLGLVTVQPSEPFKTVFVLYLASWLNPKRSIWQFFALIGFVIGLIILEPDLGTTIVVIATAFIVYFVSGAPLGKFLTISTVSLALGLLLILTSPYRRQRLLTFLDPQADPLGSSYHIQQTLLSLGSGGWFGLGLGQSKQKYQYLPEANTDSIFAIVGEETGFLGSLLLIGFYLLIIWKGFTIAQGSPDNFGRLVAVGITSWLGVQTFVNLASMVSLAPLTGIPLPFLSYGGTSLVVGLTSIGILLNISKQTVRYQRT